MIKIIFTKDLTNIDYDKRIQEYNINQFIQIPKIGVYLFQTSKERMQW